jgi:hypothetical protein
MSRIRSMRLLAVNQRPHVNKRYISPCLAYPIITSHIASGDNRVLTRRNFFWYFSFYPDYVELGRQRAR